MPENSYRLPCRNRVGIMTLYHNNYNYGGLLQAYALQRTLEQMCGFCEQISYRLSPTPFSQKLKNSLRYRPLHENICMVAKAFYAKALRLATRQRTEGKLAVRKEKFSLFQASIPHTETVYDLHTIQACADRYDVLVTGSDQVWTGGADLDTYCLSFAGASTRRVAYAASAGGAHFNDHQKSVFSKRLDAFDAIAVREKSLAAAVQGHTQRPVDVVMDPVFLLSAAQWREVAVSPALNEPYILCYLLGESRAHRRIAQQVARAMGCKLIVFPYINGNTFRFCDASFGDIRDMTSGPREFLGLIDGAAAVITDSFHATAFSLIFSKPFCALPRYKKAAGPSNGRITDLLDAVGLQHHLSEDPVIIRQLLEAPVDWEGVHNRLDETCPLFRLWLLRAVQGRVDLWGKASES